MRRLIAVAVGLAVAATTVGALAAPAAAAADTSLPVGTFAVSGTRTATTPHCVDEAIAVGSTKAPAPRACFATFAESIAYATGGAVALAKDATTVTQQQLDAGYAARRSTMARAGVTPPVTVIIGISYQNTGFTGATTTHPTSSDCDTNADVDFFINQVTAANNNTYGSAQAFGQCQGTYYDLPNRPAGSARVNTPWSGGAMDNRTSSQEWV